MAEINVGWLDVRAAVIGRTGYTKELGPYVVE